MTQGTARVATCVPIGTGPLGKTEMALPANRCIREDGVTTGDVVFVVAVLSDQPVAAVGGSTVTQVLARVATCVPLGTGPLGKTEMAGPPNRCTREDGVTTGDIVFVNAYLSDQPLPSAGGSTGGTQMNVTADIFVGAALVLCLAAGWIAGGQR